MKSLPLVALIVLTSVCVLRADRPNVIFIVLDDVGLGWIPPYAQHLTPEQIEPEIAEKYRQNQGHQGAIDLQAHIKAASECMPELSKLSNNAAIFNRAFATAALCGPSRAGILTGSFQQSWGAYRNKDVDDFGIPADRVVLAEPLKAVGYRTGVVGKWHVAQQDFRYVEDAWVNDLGQELPVHEHYNGLWPQLSEALKETPWKTSSKPGQHPLDRGFDYYFGYNSYDDQDYNSRTLWEGHELYPPRPKGEFLTDLFNEKAVHFIDDALTDDQPFFLYYAPKTLHGGIRRPPEHYIEKFNTGNRFTDLYAGHLLALDDGIGKIMSTLRKHGEVNNTLFIFSADNGCTLYNVPPYNAPNRGGKGTGWLGGLNVPLIISQPGKVVVGVNDEIASLADIMPTVLETAGAEIPAGIDGKSLLPYLTGHTKEGPRDSLSIASIQSSRWSYCYEANGENNKQDAGQVPLYAWHLKGDDLLMLTTEVSPGLYQNLPDGYPAQTLLFNIREDRPQRVDAAPSYPEKVEALSGKIHEYLSEMEVPISSQQEDYRKLLKRTMP
ncbi:MAG TPA: hypothetical protein DCX06_05190 [Opitutae bacterium]|nr:hypothetical protein [Opitutae bacterium]